MGVCQILRPGFCVLPPLTTSLTQYCLSPALQQMTTTRADVYQTQEFRLLLANLSMASLEQIGCVCMFAVQGSSGA